MTTKPVDEAEMAKCRAAVAAHGGNVTQAAKALGMSRGTLQSRMKRDNMDPAIANSMAAVGTGLEPTLAWIKTKATADTPGYSVLLKPQEAPDDMLARIRDAFEGMHPAPLAVAPEVVMADLLTVYPVMDAHIGMHAWGRETGDQDFDLKLALSDMRMAFAKVCALTPASAEGLLLIGGDFFHSDDTYAETPANKHKLDVDGRHFKVLEAGVMILAETIERLLSKHNHIRVRALRGNHDPHSHIILTMAMSQRYRDNPRITIDMDPRDVFMMQWGKCAIFAHHGDRGKPQQMALYLSDVCPFWSETRHRHYMVGHVHHDHAKDLGPLRYESLRAFCPPDAYAAGMGYGARRALQSMTFHKTDGLVLRAIDPIQRTNQQ